MATFKRVTAQGMPGTTVINLDNIAYMTRLSGYTQITFVSGAGTGPLLIGTEETPEEILQGQVEYYGGK